MKQAISPQINPSPERGNLADDETRRTVLCLELWRRAKDRKVTSPGSPPSSRSLLKLYQ